LSELPEWNHKVFRNQTALVLKIIVAVFSLLLFTAVFGEVGAFALLLALQEFGLVLAIGIVYLFLSCVYIQPTLLAVWARYITELLTLPDASPASDD
jgi:hypothetical protein